MAKQSNSIEFGFDQDRFATDIAATRIMKLGLGLREAAEQIGISHTLLYRLEQRKAEIRMEVFVQVMNWMYRKPSAKHLQTYINLKASRA